MSGFDNEVVVSVGERLESSSAQAISLMQQQPTDVSRINYSGNPEGAVSANPSSICHDPVSGDLYIKDSGTGNTGWLLLMPSGSVIAKSGSKASTSSGVTTIKSPAYADQGTNVTASINSGYFVTAAITITLPASVNIEDGDLFEFVCTTSGVLNIQAVGSQLIRLASQVTAAAGSISSTSIGDSVSLRFRASDQTFYATSFNGNWNIS